jgi:hypothetical protein
MTALVSLAAHAVPPDARLGLQGRKPQIEKVDTAFTAVEVDAPDVVRAELLPAGELLLEPRGPGVARVFLFAPRVVRALEVAVDVALPQPEDKPAPAGCAAASEARVVSQACYDHWRARLQHLVARDAPALAFEDAGLLAQLKAAQAELQRAGLGSIQIAASPFGVRLKGAQDEQQRRAALRAVWSAVLGPLRLD